MGTTITQSVNNYTHNMKKVTHFWFEHPRYMRFVLSKYDPIFKNKSGKIRNIDS